jgi:mersacidin/lichenicidin family type 2 lantibiotic
MFDVIRAWKDEEYRLSLSDEERSRLPANPVGELELTDADLEGVYGGRGLSRAHYCQSFAQNCQSQALVCLSNYCVSIGICLSFGCNL